MGVRRAVVDDVPEIARVQVSSWDGVYRGVMPDSIFEFVDLELRVAQWSNYFIRRPARTAVLVSESQGAVVAMASVGPNRDEDIDDGEVGELFAIYVDPVHWGAGHGRLLMVEALEELRKMGFSSATLWVLDANERGRSFYEAGGWHVDGASKVDESFGEPLREVRYRLSL